MKKPKKRNLKQIIATGIAALVAPLTGGCFTGGNTGAYIGLMPIEPTVAIGVRARGEIKSKYEIEFDYRIHQVKDWWYDLYDITANDFSVSFLYNFLYPFKKGELGLDKWKASVSAGIVHRIELQTSGGSTEANPVTGCKFGIETRFISTRPTGKLSLECGIDVLGLGGFDDNYHRSGTLSINLGGSYYF